MSEVSLNRQKLRRCKGKDILFTDMEAWIQSVGLTMNEGRHTILRAGYV